MRKSIKSLLNCGETVVQPVSGVSMLPMLDQHTDAVRIVKPYREIEIGDVVMYNKTSKRHVLHRVCGIDKDVLIIRGDNCVSFEYVPKRKIVAVMEGYIKNGKYIPSDDPDYLAYVKKVLDAGKPLIPEEWKYIVLLYKAAITGADAPSAPSDIDWNKIVSVCDSQKISSAIATVIPKLSPAPPENICRSFSDSFNNALKRTLLYDAERAKILQELEKENIRYLPLKAIIINNLYPKTGMREFADNDILYDKSRQNDLVRIMISLGYEVKSLQSIHDIFNKEPIFNFEMHKALFDDTSPYADFFSDILDRSISTPSGNRMSDEDFYLHFIAHYAKHHNKAGSGLRSLGDLYFLDIYNKNNTAFDRHYVDVSLEKLGLSGFEKKVLSYSESMFENGQVDDDHLRYMMSGNVYGNSVNAVINDIRRRGKLGYLFSRLFLPYRQMKTLFPWLKTMPFLLPICWFIRLFNAVFKENTRHNATSQFRILRRTSVTRENKK